MIKLEENINYFTKGSLWLQRVMIHYSDQVSSLYAQIAKPLLMNGGIPTLLA